MGILFADMEKAIDKIGFLSYYNYTKSGYIWYNGYIKCNNDL